MEFLEALFTENPVLLVFGFLAILVAIWGVITQRVVARRHTTIDFIHKQQTDKDVIDARKIFIEQARAPGGLAKWADKSEEGKPESQAIQTVLNHYELIAIGIELGILDFEIYKRYNKTNTITFWHHGAPFIHAIRSRMSNDALYHEFEQMAWWLKERKMPKRNRWRGLFF
jgi:hypothetical protein